MRAENIERRNGVALAAAAYQLAAASWRRTAAACISGVAAFGIIAASYQPVANGGMASAAYQPMAAA